SKKYIRICIQLAILFTGTLISPALQAQEKLRKVFSSPPHDALPRGYWLWSHGNFDYTRIDEELEAFRKVGLGGVDIYDFGVLDRDSIIPDGPKFLSDEQLDGITYAIRKAKDLGLKIGLS